MAKKKAAPATAHKSRDDGFTHIVRIDQGKRKYECVSHLARRTDGRWLAACGRAITAAATATAADVSSVPTCRRCTKTL